MPELADVAVLPTAVDNAAVVRTELEPGTEVVLADGTAFVTSHRVPVGHRFLIRPVAAGEPVLSWGASFGRATTDLVAGSYICTEQSLAALLQRGIADLPDHPTARDEEWRRYTEADGFTLGEQVARVERPRTFAGYARADGGYGTRNHLAVVGLTAAEGAFAEEVCRRSRHLLSDPGADGLDGIVPVAHTEGAGVGAEQANNADLVLRTLCGMMTNPNVGALVLVERANSAITADRVARYAEEHGLARPSVPVEVITRRAAFDTDAERAVTVIEILAGRLRSQQRVEAPLSALAIGMQCGGSDAFSGVSANPLSGAVARELVRHGGTAVLSETDELIGAEGYILSNVASDDVARRFLAALDVFATRAGWHGHSAEGNPSGGNILRGLHNIVLKSLGAARKKDPAMRLDEVIGYADPMPQTGFLFMDSPGNDLESVAGQVGSGCNLISFTTGNGSITNFPFVPTIKYVTTSERFALLRNEMDVDAGRYLLGERFDDLTDEAFDLTVAVASGHPTAGELAGHSQVQIWRNWKQPGPVESTATPGPTLVSLGLHRDLSGLAALTDTVLDGEPVAVAPTGEAGPRLPELTRVMGAGDRIGSETVALVLPTSLCAGQVAARIADRASRENWHGGRADRAVALPHTEGCGASSGDSEQIYSRIMINHLRHPNTGWALLLEHGCEKTHNAYFRDLLENSGLDASRFGFASIQADGGIDAVTEKVRLWFDDQVAESPAPQRRPGDWSGVRLGLCGVGAEHVDPTVAAACAAVTRAVVAAGGSVVMSAADPLRSSDAFASLIAVDAGPTLGHGQLITTPGLHLMNPAGADRLETLTGLGGCGAEVIVATTGGPGQRYVPVLRVSTPDDVAHLEADLVIEPSTEVAVAAQHLVDTLATVLDGEHEVVAHRTHDEGFQLTRGLLGVSL